MTEEPTTETSEEITEPSDSMQRRVATLLTQAERFREVGADGEADAALARVVAITLKHGVDAAAALARFGDAAVRRRDVTTVVLPFRGIYRVVLASRFAALARTWLLVGRSFIDRQKTVQNVYLVGYEDDLLQLRSLIASVQLQAESALDRWWRNRQGRVDMTPMERYKARRQFVGSFVAGATERIELARRTTLGGVEPGTSVVLGRQQDVVDAFTAANFNLVSLSTRLLPGGADAHAAGHAAGRNAATGDTPVGGNRRQLKAAAEPAGRPAAR